MAAPSTDRDFLTLLDSYTRCLQSLQCTTPYARLPHHTFLYVLYVGAGCDVVGQFEFTEGAFTLCIYRAVPSQTVRQCERTLSVCTLLKPIG